MENQRLSKVKNIMNELIEKLDKQLARLRPEYYQELKPSLSDLEIQNLEVQYKIQLPDDLKTLYKWKNGQNQNCYESFVNNSMFLSLEDILSTAAELTSMIGSDFEIENWWNENWMPVFHNGGGDYICFDCEGTFTGNAGQVIEYWHADEDRNVIAPNLIAFISQIVKYYETTNSQDFDEYFEIDNVDNYPLVFSVQ
ncbi:SMI1/KNR4 family protein [Flavobacterium piscisymbiosum]|uniref:SMI1/KNR4 family protein n=1 Tax=Flavobacterium piscisymbiosum TaxID=2893753 RepID=A0ABS8MDI4_9FLAO|nr:SMI1/KNR4 family protein [Flavobacterium sp. F-30]MCC9062795.1 SMI1/KNR4 family protein [Flavobacterium sp. F-30]